VRRVYIPKGSGAELRPLGIPTFEDKILQRAVAMVLEGSVRMENERIRVTVQLSSTETGFSLWSERFEHEGALLLDAEVNVANEIFSGLKSVLPTLSTPCDVAKSTTEVSA